MRHDNNFDVLRLLAAFLVLFSHQFGLSGEAPPAAFIGHLGTIAVTGFFAISGYVNALSLLKSKSVFRFAASRVLRIFPAAIASSVFVVVLGAAVTTSSNYWSTQTLDLFWRNAFLIFGIRHDLPGVFDANPIKGVNGSLWTLPHELRAYLWFAILMYVARFNGTIAFVVCSILLLAGQAGLINAINLGRGSSISIFYIAFVTGVALASIQFEKAAAVVALLGAVLWALTSALSGAVLIGTVLLIFIGKQRALMRLPADISYGAYLFAWPVQQWIVTFGASVWVSLALSTIVTSALAVAIFYMVESPALRLSAVIKRA